MTVMTEKRTEKKVGEVMVRNVYSLTPEDNLRTAKELMWEHNIRHLPIVDQDEDLVGLISHRDLVGLSLDTQSDLPLSAQQDLLEHTLIGDVMTEEVATVESGEPLRDAAAAMLEQKFGCLPVVSGSRLVGILTESDFVRLAAES
jgi:CBS domain-containing membrane protein